MFNKSDDIIRKSSGFIDKEDIFKYISEEDIFELVFNFKPQEFDYVVSPFREDKHAGSWFQYAPSGKLKFVDFASNIIINNVRMINIDCFDAVQVYFNLTNLYTTLKFIKEHLIDGKGLPTKDPTPLILRDKVSVQILFEGKEFDSRDAVYWKKYQISKQNLIDDKVFSVRRFKLLNTKTGDYSKRVHEICYIHTDFSSGRKKIHMPHQEGNKRFLTNCTQDDIYGINLLPQFGDLLVISKSYKDYRVLKNQFNCVVGFQNEGMIPSLDTLLPLLKRFRHIYVFFDNDAAGILAAEKVSNHINSYFPGKSKPLYLDIKLSEQSISDPSDLIYKKGLNPLIEFLKQHKIL